MVIMFLKLYINFLSILMSLNEKTQNYKVVDLIESYNFDINFIFIRHHMKELWFLKFQSCHATPGGATEQYCHASMAC
jgi:hypothetical protein